MIFADETYYGETYMGTAISAEEFPLYAARASDIIDILTNGRARSLYEAYTVDKQETKQIKAIKKATAAQTETLYCMGNDSYIGNSKTLIAREELGSGAVTYETKDRKNLSLYGLPISGIAYGTLVTAGLLYKGVGGGY